MARHRLVWVLSALLVVFLLLHVSSYHFTATADDFQTSSVDLPLLADTFVASGLPDRDSGDAKGIWIGRDVDGGFQEQISFLKFSPPVTSNSKRIVAARLELVVAQTTGDNSPVGTELALVNASWSEGLSWNDYLTMLENDGIDASSAVPGQAVPGVSEAGLTLTFDVTPLAVRWMENSPQKEHLSIMLSAVNLPPGQVERGFYSMDCEPLCTETQKPRMILTYASADIVLHNSPSEDIVSSTASIEYTVEMTNTSEFNLTNIVVRAKKPEGSTWPPPDAGGTIPVPKPTSQADIVWEAQTDIDPNTSSTFKYWVQFSASEGSTVPAIIHDPVTIVGIYTPLDGMTSSQAFTFTTNSVVNLVKFGDAKHIYLPRASKAQ